MFRAYPAHLQDVYVVIVHMQSLVSSLSAGDCLVHQLRKGKTHTHTVNVQYFFSLKILPFKI
jgi:hypothetical protein